MFRAAWFAFTALGILASPARAGLHLSSETYADLPSQWRGFLLDQRTVRQIAVPAGEKVDASPWRVRYLDELKKLDDKEKTSVLSADQTADQGALLLRLGNVDRAVNVLRAGQSKHPNHFAIAANLGTAWQLKGDYAGAAESLRQAVRLAPGKWLGAEELHLKLVLGRLKQKQPNQDLDELFGIRYFTPDDDNTPEAERKKLSPRSVGLVQQLALWLPADGPLLWQLAELANAYGDARTAASLMEGCVVQFGMTNRDLRRRRLLLKEAVAKLPPVPLGDKAGHQPGHAGSLAFRSRKPLISGLVETALPPISDAGVNPVPWEVFTSTAYEGKFPPKYSSYMKDLGGKRISLTGFLQPLNDEGTAFLLIEFPVGCWYCEMPEFTGIILLDPPAGDTIRFERGLQRVVGRLSLNTNDPEDFLFTLREAKIAPID
jgi:tetratricopeptide (TPR) repeat protein